MKHKNIAVFIPHIGCPNRCVFCDQHSISGAGAAPTPADVERILQQAYREIPDKSNTEIAFFGGSFTAVRREYMLSLLQVSQKYLGDGGFCGIRVSTRPDAVPEDILEILEKYHVTTIELGVQSMDEHVLALNRRGHTAEDVFEAVGRIRNYPFSLGLQMMVGMYGSNPETDWKTARLVADFFPQNVRIYPTVVLRHTELEKLYRSGLYMPYTFGQAVSLCAGLLSFFEEERNIPVIRLGLHASEYLEQEISVGIYHPAFRELCESAVFYQKILTLLERQKNCRNATVYVHPASISKAVGHKKINVEKLREKGYNIILRPDETLGKYEIRL